MKELLKKLRWKWHRDITELGIEPLQQEIRELSAILQRDSGQAVLPEKDSAWYVPEEVRQEHDRLLEMMASIGTIREGALKNARIRSNRTDILWDMPKDMVCAEVGVAYGDFSKLILERMQPSIFYAIDYFGGEGGGCDIWGRTDLADSHLTHLEWYKQEFEKEIQSGKMKVLQGLSWDVLDSFPDSYFDYIYLDACHSYDSVSRDVEVVARKIKEGGIIAFNDYTPYNFYTPVTDYGAYYGVVAAANRLINNSNSEVLFMGLEPMLSNDLVIRYKK